MLCLMFDHFHASVKSGAKRVLSRFIQTCTRLYSSQSNSICNRKGQLWHHNFGSAPKRTDKKERDNIIYVGNNPVERQLVKMAEEYRWNFLAYAKSDHPFSEPIIIRRASWPMQKAIKEVKSFHKLGQYLSYKTLQRLFKPLDHKEREQLIDFIISTYNVIDYEEAIKLFGTYEAMLEAMHVTTGREYDVNEVFTGWADDGYSKLVQLVLLKTGLKDIHGMFYYSEAQRMQLFKYLKGRTSATDRQVANFLRIKL